MDWSWKACTTTTTIATSPTSRDEQNHKCRKSALVDRLTSLPDELLIGILSLLPTKDAAATCILSRRLWCVFPLITTLDFDPSPINLCLKNPYAIHRYPSFKRFVDNVLQEYKSKYLTRFRLDVGGDFAAAYLDVYYSCGGCRLCCLPDLNFERLDAWISFPMTLCGLRELDLCILVRKPGDAQLPPAIFTFETLEVLKLKVNLGLDRVITMPSYGVPNLKVLSLTVPFLSDENFLPRIVSSCPFLEDLEFELYSYYVHHLTVVSTSLRRLCLRMTRVDRSIDNTNFVLIDTPNLEYLEYLDNLAFQYSITTMPHLVEAKFSLEGILNFEEYEPSVQNIFTLLRLFSPVHRLSLSGFLLREFTYIGEKVLEDNLPVFSNLKHLQLSSIIGYYFWNRFILPILNCSPVLETLVFKEGLDDFLSESEEPELEQEFFRTVHDIPSCCRYHLKRIVIKIYYGVQREVDVIQFLLRHALVLEELVVCRSPIQTYPIVDRISVENTLNNLPKASVTCLIQVF